MVQSSEEKTSLILLYGVPKAKLSLLALVPLQKLFLVQIFLSSLSVAKYLSSVHMCFPELSIEPYCEFVVGNFVTRCFRSRSIGYLHSCPNTSENGVCPVVLCTVVL